MKLQTIIAFYALLLIKTLHAHQGVPVKACGVTGSWSYADSYCKSNGCYGLVSIASSTENTNVNTICAESNCWIGLTCSSNTWQWSDGSSYSYTSWASGRPSSCECGKMETSGYVGTAKWVNDGCQYEKSFICDCPSYNNVGCTPNPTTPAPTTPAPTTPAPTTPAPTTPAPTTPAPTTPAPVSTSSGVCSLYVYTGSNYGGTQYGPFNVGDAWWAGPSGQNFPDNSVASAKLYTNGNYECTADFYNGGYPCNSLSWTLTTSDPASPALMASSPDVWISCITTSRTYGVTPSPTTPAPTTPAPTTPAPTIGFDYIGCYNDEGPVSAGGGGRAMTDVSFDGTFEGCISSCGAYDYFALQNGLSQCFCGDDLSQITKYGVYDGSNWNAYTRSDCYDDGTNTVGGSWTNAVYEYGPTPAPSDATNNYGDLDSTKRLNGFYAVLYSILLSFFCFFLF